MDAVTVKKTGDCYLLTINIDCKTHSKSETWLMLEELETLQADIKALIDNHYIAEEEKRKK